MADSAPPPTQPTREPRTIVISTGTPAAGQRELARCLASRASPFVHVDGNELLYDSLVGWVKVPSAEFKRRVLERCGSMLATAEHAGVVFESTFSSERVLGGHGDVDGDPRSLAILSLVDAYASSPAPPPLSSGEDDVADFAAAVARSSVPTLVIFCAETLQQALVPLMRRVMARARGDPDVQGVNPETPESVADMVYDFTRNWSSYTEALRFLAKTAEAKGWAVHWRTGA